MTATIRLSDGTVTLMLTKSQVRPKNGVQYFGIQVSDLASLKKRLQDGGVAISEAHWDKFSLTIRKVIGWWCRKVGGRIDSGLMIPATSLAAFVSREV